MWYTLAVLKLKCLLTLWELFSYCVIHTVLLCSRCDSSTSWCLSWPFFFWWGSKGHYFFAIKFFWYGEVLLVPIFPVLCHLSP
jgi:hypothetical protein